MPQNSNFPLPGGYRFFAKNRIHGSDAKSRMGPSMVHLGANGVPSGPKNRSKRNKITMPQNSNVPLPRGHRFFAINKCHGYCAKWRWGQPWVHLGANGVPLGPKMGQNRKKIAMPYNSNFRLPCSRRFFVKKGKLRLWRQITVGTP